VVLNLQGGGEMEVVEGSVAGSSTGGEQEDTVDAALPAIVAKDWCGKFGISSSSSEFTADNVGSKSLNTSQLKARLCGTNS